MCKVNPKNIYTLLCILYLINTSLCDHHLYQITQPVDHAEGPAWDGRKNLLYFVDIHAGNVYSYDYNNKKLRGIHLNGEVTPVIPSKDPDYLIVGLNRSVVAVEWNGRSKFYRSKILTTVSRQFPTSRFNDGKADKQGRLWFGTMGHEDSSGLTPNQGVLYKITRENLKNPDVMIAPVNISNGMAWNRKNDKFYYIDTPTRQVHMYDYSDKTGEIKNKRVVFDLRVFNAINGNPDGMTIDKKNNLWIALYNGGAVINVDTRSGQILKIVEIPAQAVTSVAWGGPNLDILYVTTSRVNLNKEQRLEQPYAGSVFALEGLNTGGWPINEADII